MLAEEAPGNFLNLLFFSRLLERPFFFILRTPGMACIFRGGNGIFFFAASQKLVERQFVFLFSSLEASRRHIVFGEFFFCALLDGRVACFDYLVANISSGFCPPFFGHVSGPQSSATHTQWSNSGKFLCSGSHKWPPKTRMFLWASLFQDISICFPTVSQHCMCLRACYFKLFGLFRKLCLRVADTAHRAHTASLRRITRRSWRMHHE